MSIFLCELSDNKAFLLSGSIGSVLYERGVYSNRCFEEMNLVDKDLVIKISQDFVDTGANILLTNTWAANTCKLTRFGLMEKLEDINKQAVQIAKQVVMNQLVYVAGTIGPLGVRLEPWGPTSLLEARDFFKTQAMILKNAGVDLFVLEGFGDLYEIEQAILAVKEICSLPVIALMDVNAEGLSLYGTEVNWCAKKCDEWGADVIGVCGGDGPMLLLELIPKLKSSTKKPIVLYPNAGKPRLVDGRYLYMANPEYMGQFAKQALENGVLCLGGSSGTNHAHMRQMAAAIRQAKASRAHEKKTNQTCIILQNLDSSQITPVPNELKSKWAQKIADKKFVTCVELLPPKGLDTDKILARSKFCLEKGFDAVNIPDGPRASARMSSLATACLIEQKIGIETILHYACRDRNLLGIQSDLLGATGLGLKNLLCVTGDPPKMGSYPNATAVFDIDAIGLVNMVTRLNSGFDLGGHSIGSSTCMSIGVGVNPVAPNREYEYSRFKYKVEAGAQWAITQPVFDEKSLFEFLDFAHKFSIPIIAGIWPLKSMRNAEFMASEVPGIIIPKSILERMSKHKDAESQMQEGVDIARELVLKIKSSIQGLQVSAPFGMVELAYKIIL